MNDIKLEVLEFVDERCSGDAILYIYSDSNLIDALTIKTHPGRPSSTSLPSSSSQSISNYRKRFGIRPRPRLHILRLIPAFFLIRPSKAHASKQTITNRKPASCNSRIPPTILQDPHGDGK